MKKSMLAAAVAMTMGVGAAQASGHLWNYTGTMVFYDAGGNVVTTDTNVTGAFDMSGMDPAIPGLGSFTTTQPFFDFLWSADVAQFFFYDTDVGGSQDFSYTTDEITTYYTTGDPTVCSEVTGSSTCTTDPLRTVAFAPPATTTNYDFVLTNPGQFGAGVFFDWSVNDDIPVLSVMQITNNPLVDGFMNVVSVDIGDGPLDAGDGTPGTAMLTAPFPGQQPSFSGIMTPVPVPAAVWLFGSGLLGLVGVARRKKASA